MAAERLGEMTREDFKLLVREAVQEAFQELLWEWEQTLPDPDEGLEFRPEVAAYLRQAMREKQRGTPLEDVVRELGLDE